METSLSRTLIESFLRGTTFFFKSKAAPQRPPEDVNGDTKKALAGLASNLLREQQDITLQDLKDAKSVADDPTIDHRAAAIALAQINISSLEQMRKSYEKTHDELIKVVITLSPGESGGAVLLWKGHMIVHDKLIEAMRSVFQLVVKAIMEKLRPVLDILKQAYQEMKEILTIAYKEVQGVFGYQPAGPMPVPAEGNPFGGDDEGTGPIELRDQPPVSEGSAP